MAVERLSFVGKSPRGFGWLFMPRIYLGNGAWECSIVPSGRLRFPASAIGRGATPADAYADYARQVGRARLYRYVSCRTSAVQMVKEDDGDLVRGVVRVGPGKVVE